MKLTPKQIEYFNKEREKLIFEMEVKKKHKINDGKILDHARMEAFKLISELHNLEVNKDDPDLT